MVALLATAREKAAAQGKPSATKEASQRGEFTTRQRELPPWTPKNSRHLHRFPRRPGGGWLSPGRNVARAKRVVHTLGETLNPQPAREMPASPGEAQRRTRFRRVVYSRTTVARGSHLDDWIIARWCDRFQAHAPVALNHPFIVRECLCIWRPPMPPLNCTGVRYE